MAICNTAWSKRLRVDGLLDDAKRAELLVHGLPAGGIEGAGLRAGGVVAGDEVTLLECLVAVGGPVRAHGGVQFLNERVGDAGVLHVVLPAADGGAGELRDDLRMLVREALRGEEDAIGVVAGVAVEQKACRCAAPGREVGFGGEKALLDVVGVLDEVGD